MAEFPTGTVTFLFTDIEGSTAAWEHRPDSMRMALVLHDELLRSTISMHGGHVFSTRGDGFAVVFPRAEQAIRAAVGSQVVLARASWPDGLPLRVRMGVHTGETDERGGDYFGPAVNRAARVMDAANGAQILVSAATREVLRGDIAQVERWVDLGFHDLRDVLEPVRLYRVDSHEFTSDSRPPRSGNVYEGNLPTVALALFGRADDVESIVNELEHARVVTLTGVGGVGKTRLALEVGRAMQATGCGGVWFAALDTIDRPEALVSTLHSLLGIDGNSDRDLSSLLAGLRVRETLLILDNCEHLLDAVSTVAAAISSTCPRARVLATSREPLGIDGERVRPVQPLGTDEDGAAVSMFQMRAEEAGASVDPVRDRKAIVQICQRLDGIPLAIELAAARTRSLRPAEIAHRLDDMFRLLTGGRRASTERHRTLRATLEWSYEVLTPSEQTLLARSAIFFGSFSLDAAEALTGTSDQPDEVIVDVLDRLVARSLVIPVDDGEETRFRLLEPVRQLAQQKLAASGEGDRLRQAHTDWYFELMVHLGELWRCGDDQLAWPIAARELPNLRASFDQLIESERIDDAERFVVAAYGPIACQFDVAPEYEWAPRARAIDPAHVGPSTASVCAIAAAGAIPQEDFDGSAAWLRQGVDAIEAGSNDDGLVGAIAIHHVWAGGEQAVSNDFLQRSVETALRGDDLHRQIWVLAYAGHVGDALTRAQQLGNRTLIALARSRDAALSSEGHDEAVELFWEAAQESHSFLMRNHAAVGLGNLQIRAGAPLDGLALLRSPARDWLSRGDARVWTVLHEIAVGFAVLGDFEEAARLAGAIGDRRLPFLSRRRRAVLTALLDGCEDAAARERYEAAGRELDAGTAVAEALTRIETLSARSGRDRTARWPADADLTARQHEVAELVARGFTNKQIAQRLGISRFTAETHVRNILERLGAASRSEIAAWFAGQPLSEAGTPLGT